MHDGIMPMTLSMEPPSNACVSIEVGDKRAKGWLIAKQWMQL